MADGSANYKAALSRCQGEPWRNVWRARKQLKRQRRTPAHVFATSVRCAAFHMTAHYSMPGPAYEESLSWRRVCDDTGSCEDLQLFIAPFV